MSNVRKQIVLMALALVWLVSIQCRSLSSHLFVTVENITSLDSIPSGSGLAISGDSLYIVSDNSPYFFKLSPANKQYRKIPVTGYDLNEYLLPKKTKHDLECALMAKVQGRDCLLAFGSGSSPRREKLLIAVAGSESEQKMVPLYYLYAAIRERYQLSKEALNIEGAAVHNNRLFLFLRKKNLVISMPWPEFEQYIFSASKESVPKTESQYIQLPKHAGVIAGFSGVTEMGDGRLLFCASLEHTSSHIDDGPIYGSYIGIIRVEQDGQLDLQDITLLKDKGGNIIREKIESLAIMGTLSGTSTKALLISDNDTGASKLFEITVEERP